jgi:hypothetical protein
MARGLRSPSLNPTSRCVWSTILHQIRCIAAGSSCRKASSRTDGGGRSAATDRSIARQSVPSRYCICQIPQGASGNFRQAPGSDDENPSAGPGFARETDDCVSAGFGTPARVVSHDDTCVSAWHMSRRSCICRAIRKIPFADHILRCCEPEQPSKGDRHHSCCLHDGK